MQNQQAQAAGNRADEIIKNLANPAQAIETEQATVKVLDQAQPVPTPPSRNPDGNWEARFKGLKSSQDKTINSLRNKVSQFDLMTTENDTLKKKLEEVTAQIPTTPSEMLEQFSQEEVDSVTKMVDGRVSGLQDKIVKLEAELGHVQEEEAKSLAQASHQQIVDAVTNAVPHYQEIDTDPAFSSWIKEADTFGNIRYNMLIAAKRSSPPDIGRIVQFYIDFANENTQAQDEPTQRYTQQELLQTPASTPSVGAETPPVSGRVWNQAMISQLYKDKATGKLDAAQFKELEQELWSARRR